MTTRYAFIVFTAALLLGVLAVGFNVFLPWSPATLVLIYSGILFYHAWHLQITHSDLTNNSPYFLGFIFFLISLFASFRLYNGLSTNATTEIVRQMGAALLTTVVGLVARQLLFAYSPASVEQEAFYRTLEEELRRNAGEFKRSQVELVQAVKDFATVRADLIAREQKAVGAYITSLEHAIGLFESATGRYPEQIAEALRATATSLDDMKTASAALTKELSSATTPARSAIPDGLLDLRDNVNNLNSVLEQLRARVGEVSSSVEILPRGVASVSDAVTRSAADIQSAVHTSVDHITKDIAAVDKLLDDFANLATQEIVRSTRAAR